MPNRNVVHFTINTVFHKFSVQIGMNEVNPNINHVRISNFKLLEYDTYTVTL